MSCRPFSLLALLVLGVTLHAQQIAPPFVNETDPDAIEAAYKRTAPYSELKWQRFDREPFILFIEEQDRGSLLGLANQRAMPLQAAAKTFAERFATPLGLKKRPRPLPVWILKDRESYKKIGGSEFSAAHFNLLHEHTVTYYERTQDLRQAFHTLMHEVVHQVMFQYTDPNKSLHQNFMSTWYMEGMAEHFATREPGPMIEGEDPGFGAIDTERIDEVVRFADKSFNWRRRSRMPFIHHPMEVMVFNTLPSYFQAVGITEEEKQDYSSQMSYFYRSSHSIVSFLDNAYQGAFRNRLMAITRLEYEGRRGAVTINQVFGRAEQADFKALYDGFVRRPRAIAEAELPREYEGLREMKSGGSAGGDPDTSGPETASEPAVRGGSFFPETGAEKETELPEAKELEPTGKIQAAMALTDLRAMLFAEAEKKLEGAKGEIAEKVGSALTALRETMAEFKKFVDDNPSKARVYLPDPANPKRAQLWRFKQYRDLENVFVLVRNREERIVRPAEIPPIHFAEAAEDIDLVQSPERKQAFGLLVALSMRDMDASEKRAIERRANRAGLEPDATLVEGLGGVLDAASAIADARTGILTEPDPTKVLDQLASQLLKHRNDADVVRMLDAVKPELIEKAFERSKDWLSGLNGKAELLPGGRVRIRYDWTNAAQGLDWLIVDPRKEGFRFSKTPESDEHKGRYEVNTQTKTLEIYGAAYLRHKLQFEGDVSLKWRVRIGEVRDAQGTLQHRPLNPGLLGINVLRPRSFVIGNFLEFIGIDDGKQLHAKRLDEEGVKKLNENYFRKLNDAWLEFRREGDDLRFLAGGTELQSFQAKSLPARGAVMVLVPETMLPKDAPAGAKQQPTAWVGDLIVEGKPAAISLAGERSRFYERWLRRFPK